MLTQLIQFFFGGASEVSEPVTDQSDRILTLGNITARQDDGFIQTPRDDGFIQVAYTTGYIRT